VRSSAYSSAIERSSRDINIAVLKLLKLLNFVQFMQGLRSKNPTILPIGTKIERTIRQKPRDNVEEEEELDVEEETMVAQNANQPPLERRPMKQSFITDNPNHSSCIAYQPEAEGNYYISQQILNKLTHFRGTPTEDPNLHLREFFDLCKFQHIQGLDQGLGNQDDSFSFFLERQR
jgi:hypothetical protein